MSVETGHVQLLKVGEKISLGVNLNDGVVGFKPEFIRFDGILSENYRKEHGEDDVYVFGYDPYEFRYDEPYPEALRFRSVRIFKAAREEEAVLNEGEQWHGRISDWRVSGRKSKDERAIIYVTVRDLVRRYSWDRERVGDDLVLSLKCGDRLLRQRKIPLKEKLYRFRVGGDSVKSITEVLAFGTEKQPVALVEFPHKTTLSDLVEAEVAGFGKLRSPAVRKAAAEKIFPTIRTVDEKTLEKYKNLPVVGRNAGLDRVLGRR
ncbi:MAG: hypothetical protein IH946_09055 [Bacteroidetes bacterium]|nr:hypothetical protein [Bacteroidota bacterium]